MAAEQEAIIHVLISLAVLLFAAKIFAEIFNKLRLPAVLGELVAGIIVGPFALGSIPIFDGTPLVILNETVLQIGQIAGIVILFIAGLAITPKEFLRGGVASFTIGAAEAFAPQGTLQQQFANTAGHRDARSRPQALALGRHRARRRVGVVVRLVVGGVG